MKTEYKAVIASVVVIALCLCAVGGVTYSWFSDTEQTDIEITTGSLSVDVVDDSFKITINGNESTVSQSTVDTGTVSTINVTGMGPIAPYDTVTIEYQATLKSNIDSKYNISTSLSKEVIEIGSIEVDGTEFSSWTHFGTGEKTINVMISATAPDPIAMGETCILSIINEITQSGKPIVDETDPNNPRVSIGTVDELFGIATQINNSDYKGKNLTISLTEDLDLSNRQWTPIDGWSTLSSLTIEGNNNTISNMSVNTESSTGFISRTSADITIKDLTFDSPSVESSGNFVGTVIGYQYGDTVLNNVHVTSGDVKTNAEMGIRVGGLIGFSVVNDGATLSLDSCSVENTTITAYHNVGSLVGSLLSNEGSVPQERVSMTNISVNGNNLYYRSLNGVGAHPYASDAYNPSSLVPSTGVSGGETCHIALVIETVTQLENLAQKVNEGEAFSGINVDLVENLDLNNEAWTPIGGTNTPFSGVFNGNDHTISNLLIEGNDSEVGLFGYTTNGEIKNLTIKNADVSGYLNVGVLVGTPYTSKYSNITITGDIKVEGFAYVGGVGGKNAYASWTNVTVNASEGSYVKANSISDKEYRTYVGGVIGFMGEGSIVMTNLNSNIDVYGSTCDVGGITGIAHYGNKFVNCSSSGDIQITNATDESNCVQIGGIAGVWMNSTSGTVTLENCTFNGTLSTNMDVDISGNTLVGSKYYPDSDDGTLTITP